LYELLAAREDKDSGYLDPLRPLLSFFVV